MRQTVAVVDASLGDTPVERNLRRELDAEIEVYSVSDGEFPPGVTTDEWRYDAVVVSGSQSSVYEDRAWIHELTEWFRRVHAAGVPTLGICWGHQFVAQALGGRVVAMTGHELGYREVRRFGDDPLFEGIPRRFTSFQTHGDRVAELPPGSVELARNDVGVQAFRVGASYGVQFHPEYDRETAVRVTESKELDDERVQSALDSVTDESVAAAREAATVFANFLAFADGHGRTRRAPAGWSNR
jgi:GMP synthase (glutamine-hydrolysing)